MTLAGRDSLSDNPQAVGVNALQKDPNESLQAAGYTQSEADLLRGLRDAQASVRGAAAAAIADQHYVDALANVETAAAQEHIEGARLTMLIAEDRLGAATAIKSLEGFCLNNDVTVVSEVATYLQTRDDEACLDPMTALLSAPDAGLRESGLLYLRRVKKVNLPLHTSLGPLLLRVALHDHSEYNRELAIEVISNIGDRKTREKYSQAQQTK